MPLSALQADTRWMGLSAANLKTHARIVMQLRLGPWAAVAVALTVDVEQSRLGHHPASLCEKRRVQHLASQRQMLEAGQLCRVLAGVEYDLQFARHGCSQQITNQGLPSTAAGGHDGAHRLGQLCTCS